jgi:hypothetical protein
MNYAVFNFTFVFLLASGTFVFLGKQFDELPVDEMLKEEGKSE